MIREEIIEVNGRKYKVFQLPPATALPLLLKITKYAAPLLSALSSIAAAAGENEEKQQAAMGDIIPGIASLEPEILSEMILSLTKDAFSVEKNVKINDPNMFFGEIPQDILPLAGKVAAFQFAPFFAGLKLNLNFQKAMGGLESLKQT
jgi:hypothetical protein